jgi:hypothetical protein
MSRYLLYFFQLHRTALLFLLASVVVFVLVALMGVNAIYTSYAKLHPAEMPAIVASTLPTRQSDALIHTLPFSELDIADLLHREADRGDLTIEEISYESRPEHDLPIVMRTASFNVTNNYATIRHYLDSVVHAQTNLTLDALDCARDDITTPEVNCVISISAYQRIAPTEANHAN